MLVAAAYLMTDISRMPRKISVQTSQLPTSPPGHKHRRGSLHSLDQQVWGDFWLLCQGKKNLLLPEWPEVIVRSVESLTKIICSNLLWFWGWWILHTNTRKNVAMQAFLRMTGTGLWYFCSAAPLLNDHWGGCYSPRRKTFLGHGRLAGTHWPEWSPVTVPMIAFVDSSKHSFLPSLPSFISPGNHILPEVLDLPAHFIA